jgi:peptide/nickel transport system substrate-binding protein
MLKTAGSVLVLIAIFFLFAKYIPTPKEVTRIGRVGKYSLDTLPADIQNQVSEGLVRLDENGTVQPGLAVSWSVEDDGRTYRFVLGKRVWHDGTPVTVADITYNFKDVALEKSGDTLVFRLKDPFSPFFYAVEKPVLKNGKYGVGEYRITHVKMYSGVLQAITLESDTAKIIYKFYPTETSALTAYKLGEITAVQGLSYIPPELKNDPASAVTSETGNSKIAALFLNNNDTILGNKPARQGLAYAIRDKSFGAKRAISPIAPDSWAYNDLVKTYDFDAERAKSLFTTDIKDPASVKIELKAMLQYLDIAEEIAKDWREVLGIQVDVKVISSFTSDYQVILADYTPPRDPDQYTIWHSTQGTNFTHYASLKVDKLLEDGRRTSNQKLRKELYEDFQRFLLEDSPAIFLFHTSSFTLSRHKLM